MAKVYSLPEQFEVPDLCKFLKSGLTAEETNQALKAYDKAEADFTKEVQAWAKKRNPTDEYAGDEYYIQHADGYAQYVVVSSKPVQLVHLPVGDAWDSPWANRTTKADLKLNKVRKEVLGNLA